MKRMHDKVAVITGAASGIGLAVARHLAAADMSILLADIDEDALAEAKHALRDEGRRVETIRVDVGDPSQIARMKIAAEDLGRVSILMNNAAREGGGGILAGANIWERTIATNMMGAVYGVQHFLPAMLAADWPCAIVNTGSKQGITLPPGDTAYNVSKAGLGAGRPWALELVINNVRLCTRCGARSATCWAIIPPMLAPST